MTTILIQNYKIIGKIKSTIRDILFDHDTAIRYGIPVFVVLLDVVLSALIVYKVPYTEIDWKAYMQEVEGVVVDGDFNYENLKGDTGPLVYPANFVWVFAFLRSITDDGINIFRAQMIFAALHVIVVALVLYISFVKTKIIPPWMTILIILSRRVHSIFMLRLFNDCVAMFFLYLSMAFMVNERWGLGCALYSFAVGIKMNIILFAPGLAVILCQGVGFWNALKYIIGICAPIQIIPAIPFLIDNPKGYIIRSFDLGRVFLHEWTVNWKFLSVERFQSPQLALLLLVLTLFSWLLFGHFRWSKKDGGLINLVLSTMSPRKKILKIRSDHIVQVLVESNFIGIVFARSLHYQFYSWYFHLLPILAWKNKLHPILSLLLVIVIEICFNIFPATPWSSLALQISHLLLFIGLFLSPVSEPYEDVVEEQKKKNE